MIKWNGQNIRPYDQIDKKLQDLFVVRNGINSAPTTRLIKNAGFICCEERNKFRPYDQIDKKIAGFICCEERNKFRPYDRFANVLYADLPLFPYNAFNLLFNKLVNS